MTAPTDGKDLELHPDGKYLATALQQQTISIRGARMHNLKNIDLDIPRNQVVVITGLNAPGSAALASLSGVLTLTVCDNNCREFTPVPCRISHSPFTGIAPCFFGNALPAYGIGGVSVVKKASARSLP